LELLMATIRIALLNVRLALRTKAALFFTFLFPLVFLFVYAGIFAHGDRGAVAYLFGEVITLQVMGSAFWGLGLQSVMARERGILRRYRLAPIGAGSMVLSSLVANFLLLLPTVVILTAFAVKVFHMPLTFNIPGFLLLVMIGAFSFAGFGLTIASIASTMQEAQIYNQLIWITLLFLSGVTIPLPNLPGWIQQVSAYLPATYLVSSFQSLMTHSAPLSAHTAELAALIISGTFGLLFAWKLFRWEKEEPIPKSAKIWALVFLMPFLLIGYWMNRSGTAQKSWQASYRMMSAGPGAPPARSGSGQPQAPPGH
ncbi:MAG TPA: ABC transporter permease, partial [Terriglobia bacterium]|nr:ABC transporter permease [Terriglobia bacterium]